MRKKNKQTKTTAVHVVLDRSGSMGAIKNDTIGAFNQYLEQLAKDSPDSIFSLTIFDSQSIDTIVDKQKAADVQPLNADTYQPRGMTPLYDAIGKVTQFLTETTADNKVLVVLTDGEENSSREYSRESIKKSLDEKQDKDNWLVIYLGANQDAFAEGAKFGSRSASTLNFAPSNISDTMTVAYASTARYMKSGNRADAEFTQEERERAAS
jgi:Mg-chelatase subunit ChlD